MYDVVENQFYSLAIISVPFTAVIVILSESSTMNNPRRLRAKAAVKRAIIIIVTLIAISTFPARA
jgi:hypothetical protein